MIEDRQVWVTIPTIGYSDLLVPLINTLESDKSIDKILITVNQEKYIDEVNEQFKYAEPNIEIVETWCMGVSIYHGWNTSIELARQNDAWLAVLNDDIRLLEEDAVSRAIRALACDKSYAIVGLNWSEPPHSTKRGANQLRQVHGSYRNHGVGGFAWVCDPHKVGKVPDDFVWWYGDDHLFLDAEEYGYKVGIARHAHVEHANELTANSARQEWTHYAKIEDAKAFGRLWPGK